ncbi:hypothetical protein N9O61_05025 [Octadecabacter sp.]|nr:hypothetical protein [Octadecabacter sp.]
MKHTVLIPLGLSALLLTSACAQKVSGLAAFIDACTPATATGPEIRADMTAAGWNPQAPSDAPQELRDLIGAHMHALRPGNSVAQQTEAINEFVPAFRASLNDPDRGQMYTRDGAVAVVFSQGEDLSCLWAGLDDADFAAQTADLGPFPPLDDVFTTSSVTFKDELSENGRDWVRNTKYSRVTPETQIGPFAVSARLDRSPQ